MALSDFAGIGSIVTQPDSGLPGVDAYGEPGGTIGGLWIGGAVAGVNRTTATGATNNTTYTLVCTIYGVAENAVYTSDGTATTTEIAAGLAAAVANLPHFGSFVSVDYPGAALFDTTGPADGAAFTITDSSGDITQAVTTAASAGVSIVPGRLALVSPSAALFPAPSFVPTSTLTAQVDVITMTYAATTVYTVDITVAGTTYSASVVGATDLATTRTALVGAINAALPASTVLAATGTAAGEIDLTAEIAGQAFAVGVKAYVSTGTISKTSSTSLPTDDIANVFGGIVKRVVAQDAAIGVNTIEFAPGSDIGAKARGLIYVSATVTGPSAAYVTIATGAIGTTGGAGILPLPASLAQFVGPAPHGTGTAILRLSAGNIIPA